MMLRSLAQFSEEEQERRLKSIRQIMLKIGHRGRESATLDELKAIRRGEAEFQAGNSIKLDDYFRQKTRSPGRISKKPK